jgi:alkaline phosphatase D
LRSYRSEQVSSSVDPAIDNPERTITGDEQMRWLKDGLTGARAQWKLVGNPVMIAPVRFPSTLSTRERRALDELTGTTVEGLAYNVDQWDGYTADRAELFSALHEHGVRNTVFLTGDIHSAWAAELPADRAAYPIDRNSVGTELVCTSVTSDNLDDILRVPPRTGSVPVEHAIRANNPHVKHVEFDSHGFSVLEVTPDRVQMDWFELADRTDPESPASHAVSFAVPSGSQHVYAAEEPLR